MKTWTDKTALPRKTFLQSVKGVHAIYCTSSDKIDTELLNAAGDSLKIVASASTGLNHVDIEECRKRNIKIGYTADSLTESVAEYTVALMLATGRHFIEANKAVYNGVWLATGSASPNFMCGVGIKDSVIGIIGFGRIGQQIARLVKPFKPLKTVFSNRSARAEEAKEIGCERVTLEELLGISDFVIVTCALVPETTGLINEEKLKLMKPTGIIINTARGAVINQEHLIKALQSKQIGGAGLDVTDPEPLPLDSPLLKMDNVVLMPHIGSAVFKTRYLMAEITAKNIINGLAGKEMVHEYK